MNGPRHGQVVVSIDVEDWPQSTWNHDLAITPRAERNTGRLLDLLASHGVSVTMFVLGRFAQAFPAMVRRIAAAGHEVASHGYAHVEIFRQTPAQFRGDVRRSKMLLEDMIGTEVAGYRAPDFSITRRTLWALDVLAELGFGYDSSIFPFDGRRYGIAEWPPHPVTVSLPSRRSIVELPPSTLTAFGRRVPVAGGGYHRLLPWPVIQLAVERHAQRDRPFIAYCHPYEFDPDEFSNMPVRVPLSTRLHQGLGRRGFAAKFHRLLTRFTIVRAIQLGTMRWPGYQLS